MEDNSDYEKVKLLQMMYEKKLRSLMRNIRSQDSEIKKLRSQSKDHRRSQLIKRLQNQLRRAELVADVLKKKCEDLGETPDRLKDYILKQTVGGPSRFRPQIREEMVEENKELKKKLLVVARRLASVNSISSSFVSARGKQLEEGVTSKLNDRSQFDFGDTFAAAVEESKADAALRVDELTEINNDLRVQLAGQKKKLQHYLNEEKRSREDLKDLVSLREEVTRLRRYQKEKSEETKTILSQSVEEVARLEQQEAELSALRVEKEYLESELHSCRSELSEANASIIKKENAHREAFLLHEQKVAEHEQRLIDISAEKDKIRKRAMVAEEETEKMKQDILSLHAKISSQVKEISELKEGKASVEGLLIEANNKVKEVQEELTKLQKPICGVDGVEYDRETIVQELSKVTGERNEVLQNLEEVTKAFETLKHESESARAKSVTENAAEDLALLEEELLKREETIRQMENEKEMALDMLRECDTVLLSLMAHAKDSTSTEDKNAVGELLDRVARATGEEHRSPQVQRKREMLEQDRMSLLSNPNP
eukprot:g4885.t1